MCKYCEECKEIKTLIGEGDFGITKSGMLMQKVERHGEMIVSLAVRIKYCPMCGRKLQEQAE